MVLISDKCTIVPEYLYEVEAQAFYSLVITHLRITFSRNLRSAVFFPSSGFSGTSNWHLQHICLCTLNGLPFQR